VATPLTIPAKATPAPAVVKLPVAEVTPKEIDNPEYPDYDALSSLIPLELMKNTDSSMYNKDDKRFTKYLEIYGDFSRMYLYTEASVNKKPLTDWDSLFVKFNDEPPYLDNLKAGGHLFRPKSLKLPKDEKVTRLLYNTSVVPYLPTIPYSESRTPITVNWFEDVFREPQSPKEIRKVRFDAFLSTPELGEIHLIALYYKCTRETPNCYIKVMK
ncbi:hypothetical protein KKC45_02065, partial [Patescibacteria group bacterium]|nr:hypothetical protein [Patescibacteria group bacterium]